MITTSLQGYVNWPRYAHLPSHFIEGGFVPNLCDGAFDTAIALLKQHKEDIHAFYGGQTLLHIAAMTDCPSVLAFLRDSVVYINTQSDKKNAPALDQAVGYRSFQSAEWLIRNNSSLHFVNQGITFTCTLGVMRNDRLDLLKLMVERGLRLDILICDPPETELSLAMAYGTPEMVKLLLSKGAKTPEDLGLPGPPPTTTKPKGSKKK